MRPDKSLDAAYFDGIFNSDLDPWGLDSSSYERAKYDVTAAAIADRHYAHALEIGCAQGALTQRLIPLCQSLLAVDISATALQRAAERTGHQDNVAFEILSYPQQRPTRSTFDLIVLSEVAYYWGRDDLQGAADHIAATLAPGGRVLLVHWTGDTDYPQTGDGAVEALWDGLQSSLRIERAERHDGFRLDLWDRR